MQLQKGQKVKLEELVRDGNFSVDVMLSMNSGTADITCFGVDGDNKLADDRYFVFYNQTSSPEGAIKMQTGGNKTAFQIRMKELPSFIKKLVVTIALDGDISMKNLTSGEMTLQAGGVLQASFPFTGNDFTTEKAIILCEIYEKGGIWRLSPVANGFNGGLNALLAYFGGEESGSGKTKAPVLPVSPAPIQDIKIPPKAVQSAPPQPAPQQPEKRSVVSLKKSGDTHKINLSKNGGRIHANLNWNKGQKKGFFGGSKGVDLDLACMYRLVTGEMGVVQALGNTFGNETNVPYIRLDQDDRTGTSLNGENMFFSRPETIDFAIVFTFIYEGAANWKETDAVVTLSQSGSPDIEIRVDNGRSSERFCVIASMTNHNGHLEIKKEEKFFNGHREVDRCYGFGFQWKAGRK